MKKTAFIFILLLAFASNMFAQMETATWSYKSNKINDTEYELVFTADIAMGYHMYSINVPAEGPLPIKFIYEENSDYELIGDIGIQSNEYEEFDDIFDMTVKYFDREAVLVQKVIITGDRANIKGTIEYQTCGEGQCFLGETDFSFSLGSAPVNVVNAASKGESSESLLMFFIIAIGLGLVGFIMPCVFPMVPMTVSFFMSGSEKKIVAGMKGLIFSLSIILIYTLVGVIVALTQNTGVAEALSNHWIPNLIFFVLFVVFACSFFGAFEITLPSSLANRADRQADKGGYVASFFLAVVLAIVSFSCTGPFVAGILVEAALGGLALKPILGMFGFGLGLSLPFVLFAFSPALMKKLPKSGGWLNSIKIFFAFILLAFGMKFLTIVDIDLNLNILTRDVFVSIWIVLFVLLGMYLLGKIKFSHDSDLQYIGVFRLFMAIASFTFAVYLIPGLFGAPLAAVSGFMPSQDKQVFDLTKPTAGHVLATPDYNQIPAISGQNMNLSGKPKYSDFLHLPDGINGYFDLKEGLAYAKQQNKPVLLDFKGHRCANCKKMDKEVFADQRVIDYVNNNYVVIGLYVDDDTELPDNEWVIGLDGKEKKTIGKVNREYEIAKFRQASQPYFAIIDHNENSLIDGVGYMSSADKFLEWLQKGVAAYNN